MVNYTSARNYTPANFSPQEQGDTQNKGGNASGFTALENRALSGGSNLVPVGSAQGGGTIFRDKITGAQVTLQQTGSAQGGGLYFNPATKTTVFVPQSQSQGNGGFSGAPNVSLATGQVGRVSPSGQVLAATPISSQRQQSQTFRQGIPLSAATGSVEPNLVAATGVANSGMPPMVGVRGYSQDGRYKVVERSRTEVNTDTVFGDKVRRGGIEGQGILTTLTPRTVTEKFIKSPEGKLYKLPTGISESKQEAFLGRVEAASQKGAITPSAIQRISLALGLGGGTGLGGSAGQEFAESEALGFVSEREKALGLVSGSVDGKQASLEELDRVAKQERERQEQIGRATAARVSKPSFENNAVLEFKGEVPEAVILTPPSGGKQTRTDIYPAKAAGATAVISEASGEAKARLADITYGRQGESTLDSRERQIQAAIDINRAGGGANLRTLGGTSSLTSAVFSGLDAEAKKFETEGQVGQAKGLLVGAATFAPKAFTGAVDVLSEEYQKVIGTRQPQSVAGLSDVELTKLRAADVFIGKQGLGVVDVAKTQAEYQVGARTDEGKSFYEPRAGVLPSAALNVGLLGVPLLLGARTAVKQAKSAENLRLIKELEQAGVPKDTARALVLNPKSSLVTLRDVPSVDYLSAVQAAQVKTRAQLAAKVGEIPAGARIIPSKPKVRAVTVKDYGVNFADTMQFGTVVPPTRVGAGSAPFYKVGKILLKQEVQGANFQQLQSRGGRAGGRSVPIVRDTSKIEPTKLVIGEAIPEVTPASRVTAREAARAKELGLSVEELRIRNAKSLQIGAGLAEAERPVLVDRILPSRPRVVSVKEPIEELGLNVKELVGRGGAFAQEERLITPVSLKEAPTRAVEKISDVSLETNLDYFSAADVAQIKTKAQVGQNLVLRPKVEPLEVDSKAATETLRKFIQAQKEAGLLPKEGKVEGQTLIEVESITPTPEGAFVVGKAKSAVKQVDRFGNEKFVPAGEVKFAQRVPLGSSEKTNERILSKVKASFEGGLEQTQVFEVRVLDKRGDFGLREFTEELPARPPVGYASFVAKGEEGLKLKGLTSAPKAERLTGFEGGARTEVSGKILGAGEKPAGLSFDFAGKTYPLPKLAEPKATVKEVVKFGTPKAGGKVEIQRVAQPVSLVDKMRGFVSKKLRKSGFVTFETPAEVELGVLSGQSRKVELGLKQKGFIDYSKTGSKDLSEAIGQAAKREPKPERVTPFSQVKEKPPSAPERTVEQVAAENKRAYQQYLDYRSRKPSDFAIQEARKIEDLEQARIRASQLDFSGVGFVNPVTQPARLPSVPVSRMIALGGAPALPASPITRPSPLLVKREDLQGVVPKVGITPKQTIGFKQEQRQETRQLRAQATELKFNLQFGKAQFQEPALKLRTATVSDTLVGERTRTKQATETTQGRAVGITEQITKPPFAPPVIGGGGYKPSGSEERGFRPMFKKAGKAKGGLFPDPISVSRAQRATGKFVYGVPTTEAIKRSKLFKRTAGALRPTSFQLRSRTSRTPSLTSKRNNRGLL